MQVELRELGFRFQDSPWLFRNLSMNFEAGSSYALTGPSGSGKSTLLSLVASWTTASEGAIVRSGVSKTNWVFQNSYGIPRRRALDHVALPLLALGMTRREATREALVLMEKFKLERLIDHEFRALSGGEAQRLMLARAIAAEPQLLLIDEPTAQLDTETSKVVNEVIGELSAEGRIVLVATHDPATTRACDRNLDLTAYAST